MNTTALTMTERVRALGLCPVFAGVPSEQIRLLAEMMDTERLQPDETLFEAGEPSDRIFVVAKGELCVRIADDDQPVRTLPAGELLGEYGMFASLARTATIRAKTDAALLSLDYERFRAFLIQFPEATLALLKTAVERLVEIEANVRHLR